MKSNSPILLNAVNAAVNQTSAPLPLDQIYGMAAQYVFSSSSAAGTISLNASCDPYNPQLPIADQLPTNWTQIEDSPFTITAGGNGLWNLNGVFYSWIQVVWISSAGTGTLTVSARIKG